MRWMAADVSTVQSYSSMLTNDPQCILDILYMYGLHWSWACSNHLKKSHDSWNQVEKAEEKSRW